MINHTAICMTDFYKLTHMMQFDPKIKGFTSYLVPRGNRTKTFKTWTMFGLQVFVNDMKKEFDYNFFNRRWDFVHSHVQYVLSDGLGYSYDQIGQTLDKIKKLHDIGYLPITINGVAEGAQVSIGCPAVEIISVHPDVPWIGQAIESWLSCALWHPSISATVGRRYAQIAKKAYSETADDNVDYRTGMCDFSMRGQESYHSAVLSAMGWLCSFYNSSTVEAADYIRSYYLSKNEFPSIHGLTSTEHSVMTSDAILNNMDERETYRRLLTEVYPKTSFAAVCDSFDFWNVLTNILPTLKDEIEAHEGFMGIRHDSASPVDALTGIETFFVSADKPFNEAIIEHFTKNKIFKLRKVADETWVFRYCVTEGGKHNIADIITDKVVQIEAIIKETDDDCPTKYVDGYQVTEAYSPLYEDMGMVETIYRLFGGSENSKGYIRVNPKLKAVYGDSITIERAEQIYERLKEKGFAADNVSLGVGSFSMECIEEDGVLKPFTRDTFSIAIKATSMIYEDENGNLVEKAIYKDPKGFSSKKSIKGLAVSYYENSKMKYIDNLDSDEYAKRRKDPNCAFVNYFDNGGIVSKDFTDIRKTIESHLYDEYESEEM